MDYYYIYIVSCYGLLLYIYSILLWITTIYIYSIWLKDLIYLASYSTLRPVLTSIKYHYEPFPPVAAARLGQSLKVVSLQLSHCTCADPQWFLDAVSGPETGNPLVMVLSVSGPETGNPLVMVLSACVYLSLQIKQV